MDENEKDDIDSNIAYIFFIFAEEDGDENKEDGY